MTGVLCAGVVPTNAIVSHFGWHAIEEISNPTLGNQSLAYGKDVCI